MNRDSNNKWMEPVLTQHLGPTAAPPELWSRIQRARKPAPVRTAVLRFGWVAVAAALVAGTSAVLTVHGASPALSIQCSSATQLQAWVKTNAGLDVPLPAQLSSNVQLSGARLVGKAVEIDYSVQDRPERLFIAQSGVKSPLEHRFLERSAKKVSWTMGGQAYTVECSTAEDAQIACHLCHS